MSTTAEFLARSLDLRSLPAAPVPIDLSAAAFAPLAEARASGSIDEPLAGGP